MSDKNRTVVNASQIRAARALLDWSQEDLAAASGLSIATIRKIETGHISPRDKTMQSIVAAMEQVKIVFIPPMGVRLSDNDVTILESNDSYMQLLDDIYHTMSDRKGEVLFLYADSSIVTEAEVHALLKIKKEGKKCRFLTEEGNTYMHYPLEEYRWVQKRFFKKNLQVIYANKVALRISTKASFGRPERIIIIDNAPLAESVRNLFEFMWENCRKPTFSTAPKIYE